MKSPTPAQVKAARTRAGLTQTEAGALIYKGLRAWQQWEGGQNPMDPAYFELFEIKIRERRK